MKYLVDILYSNIYFPKMFVCLNNIPYLCKKNALQMLLNDSAWHGTFSFSLVFRSAAVQMAVSPSFAFAR